MQSNLQIAKNQEPGKTSDSPKNPAKEAAHGSEPELTSEHYTLGLSPLRPPQTAHSNDLSSYCTNKHNSHHSLPGHLSHGVDTMPSADRNSLGKVQWAFKFCLNLDLVIFSLNLCFSSFLLIHHLKASESSHASWKIPSDGLITLVTTYSASNSCL